MPTPMVFLMRVIFAGAMMLMPVAALAGAVSEAPPSSPDPAAKYLFYMHGLYVEKHGPNSDYHYADVLQALADKGLEVIGEARGPSNPGAYARKVAGEVQALLDAGVPARNITVAGHSKGGFISLLAASFVQNTEIKYGIMAACGLEGTPFRRNYRKFTNNRASEMKGRFLVVWEQGDDVAGPCDEALDASGAEYRNEILNVGGGHRLFYQPEATWIDLLSGYALSE